MATIDFLPVEDRTLNHSCSTGSVGYTLIDVSGDTSYIYITSTTNKTSTFKLYNSSLSGHFKITALNETIRNCVSSDYTSYSSAGSVSYAQNIFIDGVSGTNAGGSSLTTSFVSHTHNYPISTYSSINDVLFDSVTDLPEFLCNIQSSATSGSDKNGNAQSFQLQTNYYCLTLTYISYFYCSVAAGNSNVSGVSSSASSVESGTSCTFSATCSVVFMGWYNNSSMSGSVVSKSKSYAATISSDTALYAFGYSVSTAGDSGISSIDKTYNDGDASVTLTANLNNGYSFAGWYLNGTLLSSSTSYTYYPSSDNTTLNAVTSRIVYTLTAYGDDNCTTNITTNDYYYGTTATFSAIITDTNNYTFVGWYSDSSYTTLISNSASYNYVITGNYTLYAKTKSLKTYYIKNSGSWVTVSKVWKKVNGTWTVIEPSDYDGLFLSDTNYVKIDM